MAAESYAMSSLSKFGEASHQCNPDGSRSDRNFILFHDNVHIMSSSLDGMMRKWDCDKSILVWEPWKMLKYTGTSDFT